jgi:hypothetical protein
LSAAEAQGAGLAHGLRPRTPLALPKRYTILFPVPVTSITIPANFFGSEDAMSKDGLRIKQKFVTPIGDLNKYNT